MPLTISPAMNPADMGPRELRFFYTQLIRFVSMADNVTVNVGNINAGTIGTFTITTTGARAGMQVLLGPPAALESGLVPYGIVTANDTITVFLFNSTGGAINPAEATWTYRVMP